MKKSARVAICGAGIAGVATAYYLLQKANDIEVILIDKNQPLSFTTSKSGENFRDFWPQECMYQFISHSIHLMDELRYQYGNDSFDMIRSGYNFISHKKESSIFEIAPERYFNRGLEEINDQFVIRTEYPYLDKKIGKIVTIKNAGKIDVYAMGRLLITEAAKRGSKHMKGEILDIVKKDSNFQILLDSKETINADKIVIATGPFVNHVSRMVGLHFPITNTLQRKIIIPDPKNIIPPNMPFSIYADSQYLEWTNEEADFFASTDEYKWLLQNFPGGLHIKPEGEGIKIGWAFNTSEDKPMWNSSNMDIFPQLVLKGASSFIPGLSDYEESIPVPIVDYAGYYTRTKENWPLIGPTSKQNVFVIGALSGFGTMAACAAGELCASYILSETELPDYSTYFHPNRYQNPKIVKELEASGNDGQL